MNRKGNNEGRAENVGGMRGFVGESGPALWAEDEHDDIEGCLRLKCRKFSETQHTKAAILHYYFIPFYSFFVYLFFFKFQRQFGSCFCTGLLRISEHYSREYKKPPCLSGPTPPLGRTKLHINTALTSFHCFSQTSHFVLCPVILLPMPTLRFNPVSK